MYDLRSLRYDSVLKFNVNTDSCNSFQNCKSTVMKLVVAEVGRAYSVQLFPFKKSPKMSEF
jgi:hypothetical protein